MNSLLLSKPETAFAARGSEPTESGMDGVRGIRVTPLTPLTPVTPVAPVPLAVPATPTAPGPLASFARFVLCGGGVGLLSSVAVALLAVALPWTVANALITVASTLLCTELHARFTFGAGRRAGWRQHWQSAGSAVAAYAVTSIAMLVLHLTQSSPGMLTEQIVYLSASGLAGVGRFLVLRLFVFAGGRNRISAPAKIQASVPEKIPASTPRSAPASISGPNHRPVSRPNHRPVSRPFPRPIPRSVPAPRRVTGHRRPGPNLLALSMS